MTAVTRKPSLKRRRKLSTVIGEHSSSAVETLSVYSSRLANRCCIVGRGRRADLVGTLPEFLVLLEHMLNGNDPTHFLSGWWDSVAGRVRFAKTRHAHADEQGRWAWDSIIGKAKTKTSIGFYPSNQDGKTRFGAIDFDAHNGEYKRARKWSLAAFRLLLSHPQLYLVLCTSGGGGFHLFIFTRDFHPVGTWVGLLKEVCQMIDAPIMDGVCEIFPNERTEFQPVGRGIRAPGTVNPKTGNCSMIQAQTLAGFLDSLPTTWTSTIGKVNHRLPPKDRRLSLDKRTSYYSHSTQEIVEKAIRAHPIVRKGTRNSALMQLIGDISHKFGLDRGRGHLKKPHTQT